MEPKIVFENQSLMVLDKPAGMVVNKADTTKEGETVQEWLEKKFQDTSSKLQIDKESDFYKRAGIVHRLDKETSGLLIVAKTPQAFENLQGQFKERKVEKKYLALVEGKLEPAEGEVNAPVGRLPWNRERFGVFPGGKEARTEYKVIRNLELGNNESYSLLELTPHTGRTHQIRVHLKYLGFPIVGDPFYGGRKKARGQRLWCSRVFLHAAYLKFTDPKSGKEIRLESQLPEELAKLIC
ncbi:MAG: RluA family pseudouridine synthase [bacterium]|nr:RluA family pseudouridine synthase [bacterium]